MEIQGGIFRIMVAAVAAASLAGGCQWKGEHQPVASPALPGQMWRAEPAKMRVYPSSRLVSENGLTVLEARVELLDEMGDSVKSSGDFHFELFSQGKASGQTPQQRLYAWDVSVQTLPRQKQFYDSVTRTYFFRLKLDAPLTLKSETLLRAAVATADGRRISAEAPIAVAGP